MSKIDRIIQLLEIIAENTQKKKPAKRAPVSRFKAPTLEEARPHYLEKGYLFGLENWHAYYQARGWKDIKNWKSTMVTWDRNDRNRRGVPGPAPEKAYDPNDSTTW